MQVTDPTRLDSWGVIYFDGKLRTDDIKKFFEFFIDVSSKHGFSMNPRPSVVANMPSDSHVLEHHLQEFHTHYPDPKLVFIILPDKSQSFYGAADLTKHSCLHNRLICRTNQERVRDSVWSPDAMSAIATLHVREVVAAAHGKHPSEGQREARRIQPHG